MAKEDIALGIEVSGGENLDKVSKSLADYKKEIKELKTLALNGDGAAAKRVGELQDKLEDLNDTTKSTKGDGIEPLTNSFALFKQGLGTGDMEKAKVGLKGIGSAMSAIPILLLVEGFKYLVDNFQDIIKFGKELFNIFSDEEKAVRALNAELENQKRTTATLVSELNREIAVMEAQGLSHDKILAKKKELIEAQIREAEVSAKLNFAKLKEALANDTIVESLQKVQAQSLRNLGLTKEADAIERVIAISRAERTKKEVDDFNASIELVKDLRNKELVEITKVETEKRKQFKATKKEEFVELNSTGINPISQKKLDDAEIIGGQLVGIEDKYNQINLENKVKFEEAERQEKLKTAQQNEQLAETSLQSINNLSSVYFSLKLANVKKGSKEEEDILRRQFEVSKKFQIAQALINGAQSVTAILSVPDFTFGVASAIRIGAAVAATAATVAKIASTQFQSTSSAGSISAGSTISAPSANQITSPQNNNQPLNAPPTTQFTGNNNNNYQPTIKAVVVETDNRNATNRINKLTNEAAF